MASDKFITELKGYIRVILDNSDSRQIFYFLLLNLTYMFVQMVYGIWTNSLGLISDAIHMFFDCLALAVGLFASVMAKWNANNTFTYGYNRVETLSGFANGIFLVLISIFIVFEAIQRLLDPPEMNTNQLLLVSFLGLLVNLVGIFAFNHGHAHGHSHGHSHGHNHGHSHGHVHECKTEHGHGNHDHHHSHLHSHSNSHSHSHSHGGHSHNMHGVFLHVLADTLGSVGVIISTILINRFGWTGFDPLASIFIAVLIFLSVIPLIQESGRVLVLSMSRQQEDSVSEALIEMIEMPGVASFGAPRFWPNDDSTIVGSIHVHADEGADKQVVADEVERHLKAHISGLKDLTVQVEPKGGLIGCICTVRNNMLDLNNGRRVSHGNTDSSISVTATGVETSSLVPTLTHTQKPSATWLNGVIVT